MGIFGLPFIITNEFALLTFFSVVILFLLYLMKPQPIKRVIPSLIFLESGKNKKSISSFFKKFIKDWLFLVQLVVILLLCLAAVGLSTVLNIRKVDRDIVFVIDVSASSQVDDGGQVFQKYIETAKKKVGLRNTIILAGNGPEIVARDTNPINAIRILGSLKPKESLSNIWDAMMVASEVSQGSTIVVLSDFIDTGGKDLSIARKLLEAKGNTVEFENPRNGIISNVGIISYELTGNKALVDVKNFDSSNMLVKVKNTNEEKSIEPFSVSQFEVGLKEGLNKVEIQTDDDFASDNILYLIIPKGAESSLLYLTNKKKTNIYSALTSIKSIHLTRQEPPLVTLKSQNLIVLDNVEYSSLLPGTIDDIRDKVRDGATLIISAQENIDVGKLDDLLPVVIVSEQKQDVSIINTASGKLQDLNFGQSSKYFESNLKDNQSIVLAEANDKGRSPVIVYSAYGNGNVLFYGIFDDANSFKSSTQYPLFWIYATELLAVKQDYRQLNLRIGDMIYSSEIRSPDGSKTKEYISASEIGVYKTADKDIAVSLLSSIESDPNYKQGQEGDLGNAAEKNITQTVSLVPILIMLVFLITFIEIFIIKKRGDI